MNYYNEFDQKAAAWLRELIAAGEIPAGVVDERSIADVRPDDLAGYVQCHFFAGVAGWPLALKLAGWPEDRPVWTGSCPCQPFSCAGKGLGTDDHRHLWPEFARLIRKCKPASVFGEQVASAAGRDWLAGVRADLENMGYAVGAADLCAAGIVETAHPALVKARGFLRWASDRCGDTELGRRLAAFAKYLERVGIGCPHIRQRLYWMANDQSGGRRIDRSAQGQPGHADQREHAGWMCDVRRQGLQERAPYKQRADQTSAVVASGAWSDFDILPCLDGKARRVESGSFPLVDGLPSGMVPSGDPSLQEVQATPEGRVMRLKGYGNAIVPELASEFISAVMECRP